MRLRHSFLPWLMLAAGGWCSTPAVAAEEVALDRAYHQAWFEWAVEGRVEDGQRRLRELARRPDLTGPWQARIALDLVRCDLLLGEDREAWNRVSRLQRGGAAALFPEETQALVHAARMAWQPPQAEVTPPAEDATTEPAPPEPPVDEPEFILPFDSPGVPLRPPDQELARVPTPAEAARASAGDLPERPDPRPMPGELPALLDALDRRAARWRDLLLTDDGAVSRVAALVGRRHGHQICDDSTAVYNAATFSFVFGTRDQRALTHNDWDVQFGNGGARIHLDMVSNDRGQVWDAGLVEFEDFQVARPTFAGVEVMPVRTGRVYLLHVLDSDTDLWVALQVLELARDEWMIFRWRLLEVPG